MKKKTTLIILLFFYCITLGVSLFAQPVITSSSSLPPYGTVDSVFIAAATVPPGAGGAGVTWNLSGLAISYGASLTIFNPSSSPYISTFPTANFVLQLSGSSTNYNYDRKSSIGLETIATSYAGAGTGVDYAPNPRLSIPFPFHYGDSVIDTYQTTTSAAQTLALIYDGYGTLITPHHTYTNVIRVKENYGGSDYHYAWYSVAPLMLLVDYSNTGSNYVIIEDTMSTSYVCGVMPTFPVVVLFPNPSEGTATLRVTTPKELDHAVMVITDAMGRTEKEIDLQEAETTLSLTNMSKGLHLYRVYNGGVNIANGQWIIQ